MNKKYIILFVGVILLFIIFITVIFFQQSAPTPPSLQSQNPAALHKSTTSTAPAVTFAPASSNPQDATKQFYTYYFSSTTNPLANGAYKNNPYLSSDFKQVVGTLYDNGNAPVFCPQNKRANIVVGKEGTVYYNNQYLTEETISEASPGTKDLYRIQLENVSGKWLVFDVNCIY